LPPERMVIGKRKWKQYALSAAPYESPLPGPLACPECKSEITLEGRLWPCGTCAGVFVENAPFEEMVTEIAGAAWTLFPAGSERGPRACPACRETMVVEEFHGATIDRCAAHGIWFDEAELAEVLAAAGTAQGGSSIGGWLSRLFFGR
jgi:hypothetical protein